MCTKRLQWFSVALCAGVVAVAGTAMAWGCVGLRALLTVQPRASGPSGSEVTVAGIGFDQTGIEIRWNGTDGAKLATAAGPDFSMAVTIPDAPDGLYSIVALSRGPAGAIGESTSTGFQIMPSSDPDSTGSVPMPDLPAPSKRSEAASPAPRADGDEASPVTLAMAGAGLLILGAVAGSFRSRRHRRIPSSELADDP